MLHCRWILSVTSCRYSACDQTECGRRRDADPDDGTGVLSERRDLYEGVSDRSCLRGGGTAAVYGQADAGFSWIICNKIILLPPSFFLHFFYKKVLICANITMLQ